MDFLEGKFWELYILQFVKLKSILLIYIRFLQEQRNLVVFNMRPKLLQFFYNVKTHFALHDVYSINGLLWTYCLILTRVSCCLVRLQLYWTSQITMLGFSYVSNVSCNQYNWLSITAHCLSQYYFIRLAESYMTLYVMWLSPLILPMWRILSG